MEAKKLVNNQNQNADEVYSKYEELYKYHQERSLLREKNQKVDRSGVNFSARSTKLDSINKFKTKLKEIPQKYDQIMKDMDNLNLSKWIPEVAKLICDASITQKDLIYYVKLLSRLHQEYEDFAPEIANNLVKYIRSGGEGLDEAGKANKRRNLVRFAYELMLAGLPITFEKIFEPIKEILADDNKEVFQANMVLAVNFVQHFNEEFLGKMARSKKEDMTKYNNLPVFPRITNFLPEEKKKALHGAFCRYLEKMKNFFDSLHKKLLELEDQRKQTLINSGKVDDETENKYENIRKLYKTVEDRIRIMADNLDLDQPKLADDGSTRFIGDQKTKDSNKEDDQKPTELFENEDDKNLYQNLIDLKDHVPDSLLNLKKQQEKPTLVSTPSKDKDNRPDNIEEIKESENMTKEVNSTNTTNNNTNNNISLPLSDKLTIPKTYEDLIGRIEKCESRDIADTLAKEFCYINNATNRKRLVKDICAYRKEYLLLFPFQCRALATLHKYFKDIDDIIKDILMENYSNLKDKNEREKRNRNIFSICEATKFKLMPTNIVLGCLQECLNSFSGHNIELVVTVLEKCGPYLLRNPDKNDKLRFEMQLAQVNNLKDSANLPEIIYIQLDNAYLLCKPPERAELKMKKKLSDVENYILYLVRERFEYDDTLYNLLSLPFLTYETFLMKQLMKLVIKGKFEKIRRLAAFVAKLSEFYPTFGMKVSDAVIEEIISGLEANSFTERQRRIANIKFFGELFCYQLFESDVVFKILYIFLDAGNDPNNFYSRDIKDHPEDTFRISMICTLLETLSEYLTKKKYKNKVDRFLVFFQKYILSKTYIPMNVEFHVLDVLDTLSPDIIKFKTFEQAKQACLKLQKAMGKEEDETKQLNELRIEKAKDVEEVKEEEDRQKAKLTKKFDDEFQEMMRESMKEVTETSSAIRQKITLPILKKIDPAKSDEPQGTSENEKKITLLVRQADKPIAKNILINKNTELAQRIIKKEEVETETREMAMASTQKLHNESLKNTTENGINVGNDQIFIKYSKKQIQT